MRPWLRRGAILILALIAAPFLTTLSKNLQLVAVVWWAAAYLVFANTFPRETRRTVPLLAAEAGQLAWMVALATEGQSRSAVPLLCVQLAAMIWLFISQSRAAAFGHAVLQAFNLTALGLLAAKVAGLFDVEADTRTLVLRAIFVVFIVSLAAIAHLVTFIRERGNPGSPAVETSA